MARTIASFKRTAVATAAADATVNEPSADDIAVYENSKSDPAIVAAAGITNGMPADQVFALIVKAARNAGV